MQVSLFTLIYKSVFQMLQLQEWNEEIEAALKWWPLAQKGRKWVYNHCHHCCSMDPHIHHLLHNMTFFSYLIVRSMMNRIMWRYQYLLGSKVKTEHTPNCYHSMHAGEFYAMLVGEHLSETCSGVAVIRSFKSSDSDTCWSLSQSQIGHLDLGEYTVRIP